MAVPDWAPEVRYYSSPSGSQSEHRFLAAVKGDYDDVAGDEAQYGTPSTEGSFGISGTVNFHTSCFSSGTITPGTFHSGSFWKMTSLLQRCWSGRRFKPR